MRRDEDMTPDDIRRLMDAGAIESVEWGTPPDFRPKIKWRQPHKPQRRTITTMDGQLIEVWE